MVTYLCYSTPYLGNVAHGMSIYIQINPLIVIYICSVLSLQAPLYALLWIIGCNYITKTCKIFQNNFFAFNNIKILFEIGSKQHVACHTPRRHGLQLSFHQILLMFLSRTGLHVFISSVQTSNSSPKNFSFYYITVLLFQVCVTHYNISQLHRHQDRMISSFIIYQKSFISCSIQQI